jgi:hypothetical protein
MDVLPRTTSKLWFFALAAIGFVIIIFFGRCAMAECLSSARQVWKEHPGSHASWRMIDDHKCWMEGARHGRSNQSLSAVASVGIDNLDDVVSRKQAPKRVVNRHRQPIALASVDSINSVVGIVADEHCVVDCVQPQPLEMVQVTCDDDCLRLWDSFNTLASMERLLPYRVRAAAWDEAYTRWASQR